MQGLYYVVLTGSHINKQWATKHFGTYPKECTTRREAQLEVIKLNSHHVLCRAMNQKEFEEWQDATDAEVVFNLTMGT